MINQSLFYLHWIHDHRGDFELAARKALGNKIQVDWSDVRVICIAPNYKKYDLHAVQVMGANIELWQYRLFTNDCLYLEEIFRKAVSKEISSATGAAKSPVMVAAGKKAALTRKTGNYTFQQHLAGKSDKIRSLVLAAQEVVLRLDEAIQEVPKKFYIAYKLSQNIVCMEVKKKCVILYLKLDPKKLDTIPTIGRDVSSIGHYGTGDLEMVLESLDDLKTTIPFIQLAYQKIGG